MVKAESQSFGELLKERRRELDLTQDQLAERVGCSPATIRLIEHGQRRPSRQIALLLAQSLRIPQSEQAYFLALARGASLSGSDNEYSAQLTPKNFQSPIPTNLPTQLTHLLGRAGEAEALETLLLRSDVRLLTFTGPPGVGKTSLALHVANNLMQRQSEKGGDAYTFDDGIFWVPLASLTGAEMVVPAIARVLSVQDLGSQDLLTTLKQNLLHKRMLLLLDNFEQVIQAAPQMAELLSACPHLKMLVTSREAMHVRSEQEYSVEPLALSSPEGANESPAVALFVERARAVDMRFALNPEDTPIVEAICARLDGLPLAIELVAARTKMLPLKALLARLKSAAGQSSHLDLLAGGARDLPDRHRTLRDAISWSYSLLSTDEQLLFRRLGVFVGGFTLAAVEAICNANSDLSIDVFDGISNLLHKNLVKRENSPDRESDHFGEPLADGRFMLLETIREYALERLGESAASIAESGEGRAADGIRLLHVEYYLAVASAMNDMQPARKNSQPLLSILDREYDNLQSALSWTIETKQTTVASQFGISLAPYWILRGRLVEGRKWLERIVADLPEVQFEADSDARRRRAVLLYEIGIINSYLADYKQARTRLEESLPVLMEFGIERALVNTLMGLGGIARLQGDYVTAESFYNKVLETGEALKNSGAVRSAYWVLGITMAEQGSLERAQALLDKSLALAMEADDLYLEYSVLRELGVVLSYKGEHMQAISRFEAFLDLGRRAGLRVGLSVALDGMAFSTMRNGNFVRAKELYLESLAAARTAEKHCIPGSLEGLAEVALEHARINSEVSQAHARRAATLLGAAAGIRAILSAVIIPARAPLREHLISQVRALLPESEYTHAYATGENLSLEDAISFGVAA